MEALAIDELRTAAMPVRFAFVCALNAAAADSLSRATAWTMSVFGMLVETTGGVTVTVALATALTPPPVTSVTLKSQGFPAAMTPR